MLRPSGEANPPEGRPGRVGCGGVGRRRPRPTRRVPRRFSPAVGEARPGRLGSGAAKGVDEMAVASRGVEKSVDGKSGVERDVENKDVRRTEPGGAPGTNRRGRERSAGSEPGPRVCGLASARDRARLQERYAAERARVEQVLARGPIGPELEEAGASRTRRRAPATAPVGRLPFAAAPASSAAAEGPSARRAAACVCRVCGGSDVDVDLVRDRGTWRLARCGRCDFFWTERAAELRSAPRVIRCRDASAA